MISMSEYFSGMIPLDTFHMIAGERLGAGIHRVVYRSTLNQAEVFKFEHARKSFANIGEWEIWQNAKDYPQVAKWLAPCLHISDGGHVMVQAYCAPVEMKDTPKRVPPWMTDLKRQNWGRIGKNVVCHDYANNLLLNRTFTGAGARQTKKVKFWEGA